MKLKELLYLVAGIMLTATLIPTFLSATELDISAQTSPFPTSTATFTPAPTDTPTPIPPTPTPTDTPTPIPPTPTNTPTDTPTPIPPTPTPTDTPTPIPPTPTPTPIPPTPTPTPIPPTPTPTPIPLQLGRITVNPAEAVAPVDVDLMFTVVFTDPEAISLNYTLTWEWGDGNATTCTPGSADCRVNSGSGTQRTSDSYHAYGEPGVYTVQATIADSNGGSDTSVYEYVVVYDPSAGFVTGGGSIDSPPGAYIDNPTLTGKANFGFVSKYQKGRSRPTGHTQFQFKVAGLSFYSDTYDWLVINQDGSNAQFKGSGTINGAVAYNGEPYRFMTWATDGDASDTADTFRIRIWYEDVHPTTAEEMEFVVYDNKIDDGGAEQPIDGGNITVHKPSRKK